MPKYYIQSGNLKRIVMADSPVLAAAEAVRQCQYDHSIGTSDIFTVSEKGFVLDREGFCIDTNEIITLDEVLGVM